MRKNIVIARSDSDEAIWLLMRKTRLPRTSPRIKYSLGSARNDNHKGER